MRSLKFTVLVLGIPALAFADSTGPLSAGTVSVTNAGSYSWTNYTPTSQASIDGDSASITMPGSGATSDETFASTFGAAVPLDATVTGIELVFEFATTGLGGVDDEATLTMGTLGAPGTPLIVDIPNTGGGFFSAVLGSSTDLWGLALTPTMVNDSGFGLLSEITTVNAGTESIDLTSIEIFYTPAGVEARFLLIGDSWAAGIGSQNVFETVMSNEGITTALVLKEGVGGSTAAQWATNHNGKLDTITSVLGSNPTVDIVHINLGGNDLNAAAGSIITEQDLLDELESIADDVDTVVDHIHSIDPAIRVGWGSYDYLADPDSNAALIAMVTVSVPHTAAKERFDFINVMGYLHYVFGYTGEFGPGATPIPGGFPEYEPAGGGDDTLPSDPLYHDGGIHLNTTGYIAYIERAFNEFYRAWLLEDSGGETIWLDFAHRGDEFGTSGLPMNDLTQAAILVDFGGTLMLKGDTADSTTPETLVLDKEMRLEAVNGTVSIGAPSPVREAARAGFRTRGLR